MHHAITIGDLLLVFGVLAAAVSAFLFLGWCIGFLARNLPVSDDVDDPPQTVPCPYCPNPDRDSVFDGWEGCQYDRAAAEKHGVIGADPPCVCDGYGTEEQMHRLGLAR